MNRRHFIFATCSATVALTACSGLPMGMGSSGSSTAAMLSGLQSATGLTANQSTASAGALMGLAQNKLSPTDFSSISNSLPGMSDMISKGTSLAGVSPSSLTSMSSVANAVSGLGVSPAQLNSVASYIGKYLGGAGNNSAASLLSGVLR